MILERTLKNLEYDKLLDVLSKYVSSAIAKRKVLTQLPSTDVLCVNASLKRTREADKMLYEFLISPYLSFDDLSDTLVSAKKNSILTLSELLKIGRLLTTSQKLKETIYGVTSDELYLLKEDCMALYENSVLSKNISDWILNENEVADKASEKLYLVRRKIRQTNENIKAKMQHYVMSNQYQKYLQDAIVTIRNGRYVIPVKTEYKTQISGLIHDQSSSGATVFIEPFPIVELNNDLVTLYAEEKAEIERIISYLSALVCVDSEKMLQNVDIISDLDVVFAKAKYAHDVNAVMPTVNENGLLKIDDGRHPLIDPKKVVPVSVEVGKNYSILLVTGANTGGKTVTLKMTGLLTVMAMSGMFIPAIKGEIPIFNSIFTDIGDEQSIQQSLSTFSAHITNISEILKSMDKNSLVLLDELGAGTDPTEGAAIAVSVTREILDVGAKAIITTHYSELKAFSFSTQGIENASMEFNPTNFAPTYKLNIGMPGASNALNIAKRLGLGDKIVDRARSYISKDKVSFENVLLDAETVRIKAQNELNNVNLMKSEIEEELRQAKRLRNEIQLEKEKLTESAQKRAKKIVEQYVEEAEEIIDKLREEKNKKTEQSFFVASKLNKRLNDLQYKNENDEKCEREFDTTTINVGDLVYLSTLDSEARILTIKPNGKCVLKVGNMELNSNISDLKKVKDKKRENNSKKKVSVTKALNIEAVSTELNIIGQNREECLYNLEYFLDKAILSGIREVRVVHGMGSGILRKAVHDFLKGHNAVKSFRLGRYGEGDNGVTIIELK